MKTYQLNAGEIYGTIVLNKVEAVFVENNALSIVVHSKATLKVEFADRTRAFDVYTEIAEELESLGNNG